MESLPYQNNSFFIYENEKNRKKFNAKTRCSSKLYVKEKNFIKEREYVLNEKINDYLNSLIRECYNLLFLENLRKMFLNIDPTLKELYNKLDFPSLYSIKIEKNEKEKKVKIKLEEQFIAAPSNNLKVFLYKASLQRDPLFVTYFIDNFNSLYENIVSLMLFKEKIGYLHGDFYPRHIIKKTKKSKNKIYLVDHEMGFPLYLKIKDTKEIKNILDKENRKLTSKIWYYLDNLLEENFPLYEKKQKIKSKIKENTKKIRKKEKEFIEDMFLPYNERKLKEIVKETSNYTTTLLKNKGIELKEIYTKGKRPLMYFEVPQLQF